MYLCFVFYHWNVRHAVIMYSALTPICILLNCFYFLAVKQAPWHMNIFCYQTSRMQCFIRKRRRGCFLIFMMVKNYVLTTNYKTKLYECSHFILILFKLFKQHMLSNDVTRNDSIEQVFCESVYIFHFLYMFLAVGSFLPLPFSQCCRIGNKEVQVQ